MFANVDTRYFELTLKSQTHNFKSIGHIFDFQITDHDATAMFHDFVAISMCNYGKVKEIASKKVSRECKELMYAFILKWRKLGLNYMLGY